VRREEAVNHRNLDALADCFSAMLVAWRLQDKDAAEPDPAFAAEFLASHGILAVTVLTHDEAVKIAVDATRLAPSDSGTVALCIRELLEQIAKGQLTGAGAASR
jgi:hypothetical protein